MKVLWLCNCEVFGESCGSGTWLGAMAQALLDQSDCEIVAVSPGAARSVRTVSDGRAMEYRLPDHPCWLRRDAGRPPPSVMAAVSDIVRDASPSVVQIWGVELHWGLLPPPVFHHVPVLLTVQGLKLAIAPVYYGGLSWSERLRAVSMGEILRNATLSGRRKRYADWGRHEKQIIRSHQFVETHSSWATAHVAAVNPDATVLQTDRLLRAEFYAAPKWAESGDGLRLFYSSGYPAPFKGLHILIEAFALVLRNCPSATLTIAGIRQVQGLRRNGYLAFVEQKIRTAGLAGRVRWMGPLHASAMIDCLRSSHIAVFPSCVESYGVAMAEAMYLGVPVVSAYNGGAAMLGRDEQTCLFFPPGDAALCGHQILRLAGDSELRGTLSRGAIAAAAVRHDPSRVVKGQLANYRHAIEGKR